MADLIRKGFKCPGTSIPAQLKHLELKSNETRNVTFNESPNYFYGDAKRDIFLVFKRRGIKLRASAIGFESGENLELDLPKDLPPEEAEDKFDELISLVKLIIINPWETLPKTSGFCNIIIENFNVTIEEQAYIVVDCEPKNSVWLLPTLINYAYNVEYVIAPTVDLHFEKIYPNEESILKYLACNVNYLPSNFINIFPGMMVTEYSISSTHNTITYYRLKEGPAQRYESRREFFDELSTINPEEKQNFAISLDPCIYKIDVNCKYVILIQLFEDNANYPSAEFEKKSVLIKHLYIDPTYVSASIYPITRFMDGVIEFIDELGKDKVEYWSFVFTSDIFTTVFNFIHGCLGVENIDGNIRLVEVMKAFRSLKALRICVDDGDLNVGRKYYEKKHTFSLDLTQCASLEALSIITVQHCIEILELNTRLLSLTTNSLPIPTNVVKATSEQPGILTEVKEFIYYYDFLHEPSDFVVLYAQNCYKLEILTIIGEIIPLDAIYWKQLWMYVCNTICIKRVKVVEKQKQLVHPYIEMVRDPIRSICNAKDWIRLAEKEGIEYRLTNIQHGQLEYINWYTLCVPCLITFRLNHDLLYIHTKGYIFFNTDTGKSIEIIHSNGNLINFENGGSFIKFMFIDSFAMLTTCFGTMNTIQLHDRYKFEDVETLTFKGHLANLNSDMFKPEILTIQASDDEPEEDKYNGFMAILSFESIKIVRGSFGPVDFAVLIGILTRLERRNPITIYVTGIKEIVDDGIINVMVNFCTIKRVLLFRTPWSVTYNGITFENISSHNIEEIDRTRKITPEPTPEHSLESSLASSSEQSP